MIELCDECDYTILIADLIATLMSKDKDNESFTLNVWLHGCELPFEFDSSSFFNFLQEGFRVEDNERIMYIFYDEIEYVRVDK